MSQYERIQGQIRRGQALEKSRRKQQEVLRQNAQANRPRVVCPACGKAFFALDASQKWCVSCLTRKEWSKQWQK